MIPKEWLHKKIRNDKFPRGVYLTPYKLHADGFEAFLIRRGPEEILWTYKKDDQPWYLYESKTDGIVEDIYYKGEIEGIK